MKRYVLEADKSIIEKEFNAQTNSNSLFKPNYNVIPESLMPIVIKKADGRVLLGSVWGLKFDLNDKTEFEITYDEVPKNEYLNKKIQEKPCIIPASGFYKWKETVDDPLPFYLRVLSQEVMGLAGIYTSRKDENGNETYSYAVLTMPANALVEPLDNSMPVILNPTDYGRWLSGHAQDMIEEGFSGNHLLPDMSVFRVPELVNDPSNNFKELIQPIPKLRNYDGDDD